MIILVAGAGGYVGIPLCQRLAKLDHTVIALDRYFFGKKPFCGIPQVDKNISVLETDIREIGDGAFKERPDVVVDLAGLSNDASCEIDESFTTSINVGGAKALFDYAQKAGASRYVYSSSASVYGAGCKAGLTETDAVFPLTAYARAKLEVEKYITQETRTVGAIILRNSTLFGLAPRMRFDLAVNAMVRRAWTEKVIYIMGGGRQLRPFVHIEDAVTALIWAITDAHHCGIFNVGFDKQQLTIQQLASKVAHFFPEARIHHIPEDDDERSYHLSFAKYGEATGQTRYWSVESGIVEIRDALVEGRLDPHDPTGFTVQWYKSMLEWDHRLKNIKKNYGWIL